MPKSLKIRPFLLLLPAALLSSCASGSIGQDPSITLSPTAEMPAPARVDLMPSQRPYYLGPYDKVAVDVFGMPEMKRTIQVDASGRIAFPLAGVVEVSGLTPFELGRALEQRLKEAYVRDPQVTVNLEDAQSQFVTVSGEVVRPGPYPVIGQMTLNRAIARAGGLAAMAKRDEVVVFRTVEGQKFMALYDLKGIRQGNYPDPEIFSNDMVIVGESRFRRLFQDAVGATALLSPIILLSR